MKKFHFWRSTLDPTTSCVNSDIRCVFWSGLVSGSKDKDRVQRTVSSSKSIAITGSNGKTTTANLVYEIFQNTGLNVLLGGNIGTPFSTNVLKEICNKNDKKKY